MDRGILPVNSLLLKFKAWRLVKRPMDSGILPFKSLEDTSRVPRFVNKPISLGIVIPVANPLTKETLITWRQGTNWGMPMKLQAICFGVSLGEGDGDGGRVAFGIGGFAAEKGGGEVDVFAAGFA